MWHNSIWMGYPMRLELTLAGLPVKLANLYTTRGALYRQRQRYCLKKRKKGIQAMTQNCPQTIVYIYSNNQQSIINQWIFQTKANRHTSDTQNRTDSIRVFCFLIKFSDPWTFLVIWRCSLWLLTKIDAWLKKIMTKDCIYNIRWICGMF